MSKILVDIIIGGALFYLLLCVGLYFVQRSMIYFPDRSRPAPIDGVEIVDVTAQDGQKIQSWYFAPTDPQKPTIIYFHGNAGNYAQRIYKAIHYIEKGYGVLLAEYRGYGGNDGDISEVGLYLDARAQINWLLKEKSLSETDIVIYGESIGSGIAVEMATEYKAHALILETPFSSLYDIASSRYFFLPVKYLLKDKYMNIEKIRSINMPLLIMHGRADNVIPFAFAEKLYKHANQPKKLIVFPDANHNNLYEYRAFDHVIDFLTGLGTNNIDNKE